MSVYKSNTEASLTLSLLKLRRSLRSCFKRSIVLSRREICDIRLLLFDSVNSRGTTQFLWKLIIVYLCTLFYYLLPLFILHPAELQRRREPLSRVWWTSSSRILSPTSRTRNSQTCLNRAIPIPWIPLSIHLRKVTAEMRIPSLLPVILLRCGSEIAQIR